MFVLPYKCYISHAYLCVPCHIMWELLILCTSHKLAWMSVIVVDRPLKPEITSVKSGSYDITVAWKQSSLCYEQFQFTHEVQWKKESETEWSHSTLRSPATKRIISGLSAATSYNIQVRAAAVDPKFSHTTHYSQFTEQNIVTSSGVLTFS